MQITKIYCDLCGQKVYQEGGSPHDYPREKLILQVIKNGIYGTAIDYTINHETVCLDCHEKIAKAVTDAIGEIKRTSTFSIPD